VRGVVCENELPEGATLIGDTPRKVPGQLEGRSGKPSSPSGWAGQAANVTDDRLGWNGWCVAPPAWRCASRQNTTARGPWELQLLSESYPPITT